MSSTRDIFWLWVVNRIAVISSVRSSGLVLETGEVCALTEGEEEKREV